MRLIMYGRGEESGILKKVMQLVTCEQDADHTAEKESLVSDIYDEIYHLLELSTRYGFDENLWQCYIAYILAMDENPFSMLCETVGASGDGSVNQIVKQDMGVFYRLFHYDFPRWKINWALIVLQQ